MSKRLQVILDDAEMRDIQRIARRQRTTVAEWVRRTLRAARQQHPSGDRGRKLEAVRVAARHAFPTAPVDQMLHEIERGYVHPPEREP
jgi:hypothetical protein